MKISSNLVIVNINNSKTAAGCIRVFTACDDEPFRIIFVICVIEKAQKDKNQIKHSVNKQTNEQTIRYDQVLFEKYYVNIC